MRCQLVTFDTSCSLIEWKFAIFSDFVRFEFKFACYVFETKPNIDDFIKKPSIEDTSFANRGRDALRSLLVLRGRLSWTLQALSTSRLVWRSVFEQWPETKGALCVQGACGSNKSIIVSAFIWSQLHSHCRKIIFYNKITLKAFLEHARAVRNKMQNVVFLLPLLSKFVFWSTGSHFHVNANSNTLKQKWSSPKGGGGGDSRKYTPQPNASLEMHPFLCEKISVACFLQG